MSFNISNSWSEPAVRIAAAGVGFLVGGPLGAALGGWHAAALAGTLGECGKKLAEECAEKFGTDAAKRMFGPESGGLKEPSNTLEQVYRKALGHGLEEVRSRIAPDFEDWFENWGVCLSSAGPLDIPPIHPDQLVAEDLDPVFQRTMERLDAQGASYRNKSVSLKQERRTIPGTLLAKLAELLPEHFRKWFHDFIQKPEYEQAWKEKQQQFQDTVTSLLASIKSDTSQIKLETSEILNRQSTQDEKLDEIRELLIALGKKDGRISPEEARALSAEAEAAEWKRKFIELTKSSPSLDELLSSGDFEAAALKKTQQLEKQSSGLAQSYFELGTIHELRFDWPKALAAYREAWRLECNTEYGFRYGHCAQEQKQFSEAIATYERLRDICTSKSEIARAYSNLGAVYGATGRTKEAVEACRQALSIRATLVRENPKMYLPDLADTLNQIAILYCDTQQLNEAEEIFEKVLAIRRSLAHKNLARFVPEVAFTLNSLAIIYSKTQRTTEAEKAFQEVIEALRLLAEDLPEIYLPHVATALNNLAALYSKSQQSNKAEAAYVDSLSIRRAFSIQNPEGYLPDVAATLNSLAIIYSETEQFKKAESSYLEALSIRRKLARDNPGIYLQDVAATLNSLAILYSETQRLNEAEEAYQEAIMLQRQLAEAKPGIYLANVASMLNNLAAMYKASSKNEKAEYAFIEALSCYAELMAARYNPEFYSVEVARTLNKLATLYREEGRIEEAREHYEDAEELLQPVWSQSPSLHGDLMARILWNQVLLYEFSGHSSPEAEALARRALASACSPDLKHEMQQMIDLRHEDS